VPGYLRGQTDRLELTDRGLAYGDGLFETMALRDGRIRLLELHLQRLAEGCARLQIPAPDQTELRAQLAASAAECPNGTLKLILTRGSGPRGYAPPERPEPTLILSVHPRADVPGSRRSEVDAVTLRLRLGENPELAGIKHLCRLEQVMAQLELKQRRADEGLLLSMSGKVIGGTSSNLFAVFGRQIRTPLIAAAGIRGVMRRAVLDACVGGGLRAAEVDMSRDELLAADEVFLTNALIGIRSVASLDGQAFPERGTSLHLRRLLGLDEHG
jgi:4-amino-4-deoxychorismate lyase